MIDNSLAANQPTLARNFATLINQLVNPPDVDPKDGVPDHAPVRSLHVGVISTDLGTPGSNVPSYANSDIGDDGLLNPIRNGQAIRSHQPWTTAPAGVRPARCGMDPDQYPAFLTFDAATTDPAEFRDDFVCNAYLSGGGCGLEAGLRAGPDLEPRSLRRRATNERFTSLKPGAPPLVVFGAITGVPIQLPRTPAGRADYDALLGRNPDGSDGYTAMSPEGPISMRQRNMDPRCSTRVVPARRREGSPYDPMRPACNTNDPYFACALPAHRAGGAPLRRAVRQRGAGVDLPQ